jgi:hypothetical protein
LNGTGSGGAHNALLALWRTYRKKIMDAGLNVAAICLYFFMVFGGLWFFFADLVHIQGEHVLRGSITLCP